MGKRWVFNASPVILLAKAQVINFVPRICDELIIPSGAANEVRNALMSDEGRKWLENEGKPFITEPVAIPPAISAFGLGLGETKVLAWVRAHPNFEGVLDDLKARRCANAMSLPIIGSLRVVIILKEQKLIPAIKPALQRFVAAGSYFSPALIAEALKIAGET